MSDGERYLKPWHPAERKLLKAGAASLTMSRWLWAVGLCDCLRATRARLPTASAHRSLHS